MSGRAMLREIRDHRQHILAGRDLIAAELRHNAAVIQSMRSPATWKQIRGRIALDRWEQYGGELSILRKNNIELWGELVAAYERLQFGRESYSPGITAETLNDLATRLAGTEV